MIHTSMTTQIISQTLKAAVVITALVSAFFFSLVVVNRVTSKRIESINTTLRIVSSNICLEYVSNVEVLVCRRAGVVYRFYRTVELSGFFWSELAVELVFTEQSEEIF